MKFWQKAFLGILIVFIVAINICLYLTSQYSFSLNLKRDSDRALGEYHSIINGIDLSMSGLTYRGKESPSPASVGSLMRSYSDYYKDQKVYLQLAQSGKLLYSNIPDGASAGLDAAEPKKGAYSIKVLPGGGTNYLYITGSIGGQYEDYSLTYVRDLTELYDTHSRLTHYLIAVSALVETLLALTLFLILRRLTNPVRRMQKAAGKIACGVYGERISVPGKDEFHELAENFNRMAASIQEKISELDKSAQDKQRLIDNLAHELRTPLTAIRGYAELLENASTDEQTRRKAVGYIISETDRIRNLSVKLLDLALIKNNKAEFAEIVPMELFMQVETLLGPKLKAKGIRLIMGSSLERISGDFILLQSLLTNLVDNAANASIADSSIELSAYYDTGPVIEVRDSGCGMDDDQAALVCEPFYRVDKARSRSSGGVGLGLSLCREIARLHEAELVIKSAPGEGTTVQLLFTTSLQLSEDSLIPGKV